MRKYPKVVQADNRGQIVIPKDVRQELGIEAGAAFWVYTITDEGILLKKIEDSKLSSDDTLVKEIKAKASKIDLNEENLNKSVKRYSQKQSKLEEL
ncbi:AbrB/MazE/SpoVT family DNA-binding domain-containing protein [Candidatus Woesearchaeota archaeon]|nr:MAG: AbrB/MazE/SpoVT family DNA-binding domain-containing protein [Candidatus Woesearchaeota archaeon]